MLLKSGLPKILTPGKIWHQCFSFKLEGATNEKTFNDYNNDEVVHAFKNRNYA